MTTKKELLEKARQGSAGVPFLTPAQRMIIETSGASKEQIMQRGTTVAQRMTHPTSATSGGTYSSSGEWYPAGSSDYYAHQKRQQELARQQQLEEALRKEQTENLQRESTLRETTVDIPQADAGTPRDTGTLPPSMMGVQPALYPFSPYSRQTSHPQSRYIETTIEGEPLVATGGTEVIDGMLVPRKRTAPVGFVERFTPIEQTWGEIAPSHKPADLGAVGTQFGAGVVIGTATFVPRTIDFGREIIGDPIGTTMKIPAGIGASFSSPMGIGVLTSDILITGKVSKVAGKTSTGKWLGRQTSRVTKRFDTPTIRVGETAGEVFLGKKPLASDIGVWGEQTSEVVTPEGVTAGFEFDVIGRTTKKGVFGKQTYEMFAPNVKGVSRSMDVGAGRMAARVDVAGEMFTKTTRTSWRGKTKTDFLGTTQFGAKSNVIDVISPTRSAFDTGILYKTPKGKVKPSRVKGFAETEGILQTETMEIIFGESGFFGDSPTLIGRGRSAISSPFTRTELPPKSYPEPFTPRQPTTKPIYRKPSIEETIIGRQPTRTVQRTRGRQPTTQLRSRTSTVVRKTFAKEFAASSQQFFKPTRARRVVIPTFRSGQRTFSRQIIGNIPRTKIGIRTKQQPMLNQIVGDLPVSRKKAMVSLKPSVAYSSAQRSFTSPRMKISPFNLAIAPLVPPFTRGGGTFVISPIIAGGWQGKQKRKIRRLKAPQKYKPSVTAVLGNVWGKKPSKRIFTGFELRPRVRRKRKKR